jgi:transcription elongation factor Elf1
MNEEKRNINNIKEIEFKCKECNAKIILELNEKANMPTACCNCGESFGFDPMENPLRHLQKSITMFNTIKSLQTSFICGDNHE